MFAINNSLSFQLPLSLYKNYLAFGYLVVLGVQVMKRRNEKG